MLCFVVQHFENNYEIMKAETQCYKIIVLTIYVLLNHISIWIKIYFKLFVSCATVYSCALKILWNHESKNTKMTNWETDLNLNSNIYHHIHFIALYSYCLTTVDSFVSKWLSWELLSYEWSWFKQDLFLKIHIKLKIFLLLFNTQSNAHDHTKD